MRDAKRVEMLKHLYPAGTRLVLDCMNDSQAPPCGTEGTVIAVDSMGTIHVKWDNGCGLGLIDGVDAFHKKK